MRQINIGFIIYCIKTNKYSIIYCIKTNKYSIYYILY